MGPFCNAKGLPCFHDDGRPQLFSRKWAHIQGSSLARYLLARYLLAEDACYHRGGTTRLRRFAAVVGPKFFKIPFIFVWNPFVSIASFRRGFAYLVELYLFTLEFLGVVEIPSYQEIRMTRGSNLLWHSLEPKYFLSMQSLCWPWGRYTHVKGIAV